MEKSRKVKILSIITLVLAISVITLGFAAFSTTFTITSSANVTPTSADFAVKFSASRNNLVVSDISPTVSDSVVIASKGKISNDTSPTLTNLSATFTKPGQHVEYILYARNEGEYTAYLNNINYIGNKKCVAQLGTSESLVQNACEHISIIVTIENQDYTETTPVTAHVLEKNAGKQIKVKIEYSSSGSYVDGPFSITFPSISLVYSTVDDPTITGKVVSVISGDINTPGSIVAIGNEQFYVLGLANDKVKMLSMYNLHVGNIVEVSESIDMTKTKSITAPTGVQNEFAKGNISNDDIWIGVTEYSKLNSTYSESVVEEYVNNYAQYLKKMGADILGGRLITIDELESLGCSRESRICKNAPSWVYSTSYWTGTANDTKNIWIVNSNGNLIKNQYNIEYAYGVRPVIEISQSEFN